MENLKNLKSTLEKLPINDRIVMIDFKNELDKQKLQQKIETLEKQHQLFQDSINFKINVIIWLIGLITTIIAIIKFIS